MSPVLKWPCLEQKRPVRQEDEGELQIVTKNGDAGRAFSRRQIEIETRRIISFPLFHGHPDKSDLNPTKSDITRIDYSFNGDTLSFQCIVRKIGTVLPTIVLRMLVITNVNLPILLIRTTNTKNEEYSFCVIFQVLTHSVYANCHCENIKSRL